VHNHPSGDPQPSDEDIAVTRRLVHAADLLGIRVLDHVIVGDGTYASFKEAGLL
jgi:DNA repair protein RadC